MHKKIQNIEVENKKVIVRCDFNVPIIDGTILDNSKIMASLETIEYLIKKEAKIILLSHFGKVKNKEDKAQNSLLPIYEYLKQILNTKVYFSSTPRSLTLEQEIDDMNYGEVMLLENTRFEDLNGNLESGNDIQLAMYWASLADIFCLDAFGSAHRKHASTYGIASYLPSCIGFLVQHEIESLEKNILNAEHPFTIVMGGAKVEDKVELLESLLPKCDNLLLAGGIANSCLSTIGFNVGESLRCQNPEILNKVKKLLIDNKEKITLPLDAVISRLYDENFIDLIDINEIDNDDCIYDIGSKTIEKYKEIINNSKTIFINGTCGKYENPKFANGTKEILTYIANSQANKVVGGGDGVSAVKYFKLNEKFDFLSTGGGATLEYIIKGTLPAIENIENE